MSPNAKGEQRPEISCHVPSGGCAIEHLQAADRLHAGTSGGIHVDSCSQKTSHVDEPVMAGYRQHTCRTVLYDAVLSHTRQLQVEAV